MKIRKLAPNDHFTNSNAPTRVSEASQSILLDVKTALVYGEDDAKTNYDVARSEISKGEKRYLSQVKADGGDFSKFFKRM